MVDQLALEDFEIELFVKSYNEIDFYGNGYIDWDTLLHYVGFDHEDMPIFFDYLLAFSLLKQLWKSNRNEVDIFRFGDFVRFGVYVCSILLEGILFNYADTTGEGLVDLDEMCRLITALQIVMTKVVVSRWKNAAMMKRYFSKQKLA